MRGRALTAGIVALAAIACGWWATQHGSDRASLPGNPAQPPADRVVNARRPSKNSIPAPLSVSAIRSSAEASHYVGAAACADCHADQQRTYLHTAHSQAMSDLNPAAEPPDGEFHHGPSGRHYTVYRRDGQLRHREAVRDETGNDVAAADYPIRYLIGSGRHTRSYLVEVDGFLVQSPITWYVSRKDWGMSPGYDRPNHRGFERSVDATCLVCHVGQMSSPDREYQRFTFPEKAIDCERCHGPGSLHVAEERAIVAGAARPDVAALPSIVNPRLLTRELKEAICAQCHLMGDAAVVVRGRGVTDFRPGLPLSDFMANYRLDDPDARQMKVVGHVDQMRQSRCWQAADKLTCTTCHDQHSAQSPIAQREHYLQTCLSCHAEQDCRLERSAGSTGDSAKNCVDCHMPQTKTEIPHIAFTHHRIGVHTPETLAGPQPRQAGMPILELKSMDDESQRSARDRQRNLGLAYIGLSLHEADPLAADAHRNRARLLLEDLHAGGLYGGETLGGLARIAYANGHQATALRFANEALDYGNLLPKTRVNCLFYMGQIGVRAGDLGPARQALEQLVALRWLSEDWNLLAALHQREQNLPAAQRDLEHAASIAPFRPDLRRNLAQVYEWQGNSKGAERERAIALQLSGEANVQRPSP